MSSKKEAIRDSYTLMLMREYLREKLRESGFSNVEIEKTLQGRRLVTNVTLYVMRRAVVIGRRAAGLKDLADELSSRFGLPEPRISVKELNKPELSPSVMCNRMATHISRGIAFRRATMWTLRQIMDAGAMGVQITVSGKLRGDRSAFEKHTQGILPRAGHDATLIVSEDISHVKTPMGLIGVRIRIARKGVHREDFEMVRNAADAERRDAKQEKDGKVLTESEQIALEAARMREMEATEVS